MADMGIDYSHAPIFVWCVEKQRKQYQNWRIYWNDLVCNYMIIHYGWQQWEMWTCYPYVIVSHSILQKNICTVLLLLQPLTFCETYSTTETLVRWASGVGWCRLLNITGTPFSFMVNTKESRFTRLGLISVSDYYLGAPFQVVTQFVRVLHKTFA